MEGGETPQRRILKLWVSADYVHANLIKANCLTFPHLFPYLLYGIVVKSI